MPIKTVIFYFSQTLNTKKYTEKIAEGIKDGANECDLFRLKKLKEDLKLVREINYSNYDLIGFGTPVYYFHPPYHIFDILEALPPLTGKKGFLYCTSGGNPGSTLYQMKEVLDKKELKIIDGNDKFIGLDRHPLYRDFDYTYPPSIGHPTDDDLKKAKKWGAELIKKALNPNTLEKTDFRTKNNPYATMQTLEVINKQYPKFELNEDKCIQCEKCVELCPVDCIIMDPYPKWIKSCDRCYICYMQCPEQAIECDWSWQADHMTGLMKKKGFLPNKH